MIETTKKHKPLTAEQKAQRASYMRQYRRDHPDKMRMYEENRIKRKAMQLLQEMQDGEHNA